MRISRNPTTIHPPLAAYSHQIEIQGSKRWLVLSGQIGMKKDGALLDDPIQQLKFALSNIEHNLREAGMQISDLVKLTVNLAGDIDSEHRRRLLSSWLDGYRPTMTLLFVAALASPNIKVELDALACTDGN